jgi:hypothetical protein
MLTYSFPFQAGFAFNAVICKVNFKPISTFDAEIWTIAEINAI